MGILVVEPGLAETGGRWAALRVLGLIGALGWAGRESTAGGSRGAGVLSVLGSDACARRRHVGCHRARASRRGRVAQSPWSQRPAGESDTGAGASSERRSVVAVAASIAPRIAPRIAQRVAPAR